MKNLTKITLLAISLVATQANAGFFDTAMTSGWKDKQPTSKYELETYGYDVRVYEWTPEGNPNVRCVAVTGKNGSYSVACYEVKKEK